MRALTAMVITGALLFHSHDVAAQQFDLRASASAFVGLARTGAFFPSGVELRGGVRADVLPIPVLLQLDVAYARVPGDSATLGVGGARQEIWNSTLSLVYRLPLSPRARVCPYILAGGGAYHRPDIAVLGLAFTSVGLHAGGGFDGRLLSLPIFVEARYADVLLQQRNVEYLTIGAGIHLGFH